MKYNNDKLKLRVFFGHTIVMVTYCDTKVNQNDLFTNDWDDF